MTLVSVTFCPFGSVVVMSVVMDAGIDDVEDGDEIVGPAFTQMEVVKVDVETVVVSWPALLVTVSTTAVPV